MIILISNMADVNMQTLERLKLKEQCKLRSVKTLCA
jgi:hypothetical protein